MNDFYVRTFKINNDFIRIDIRKEELKTIDGFEKLNESENEKFHHHISDLAKEISLNKPHLISIYKNSEDKYYGPFIGPSIPISDILGLIEALHNDL